MLIETLKQPLASLKRIYTRLVAFYSLKVIVNSMLPYIHHRRHLYPLQACQARYQQPMATSGALGWPASPFTVYTTLDLPPSSHPQLLNTFCDLIS
jgi:hypothetical protein